MHLEKTPKALFGHRVLVLLDPITAIGLDGKPLELPDKRTYNSTVGIVHLVGDSKCTMQLREFPLPVKNGDVILMADQGFEPITIKGYEGATFRLCHGDDILGVL